MSTTYFDFVAWAENLIKSITWTNYGTTPQIVKSQSNNRRGKILRGVELRNSLPENPRLALNGSVMNSFLSGSLIFYERNEDDILKLKKDIIAGFQSLCGFRPPQLVPLRVKNHFEMEVIVTIIE